VRRQSIIINLPGSPKGVRENLEVVLPALTHGLKKLKGDPTDCAQ
jgi:molybdopterin biosynthesis enzyme MoaB